MRCHFELAFKIFDLTPGGFSGRQDCDMERFLPTFQFTDLHLQRGDLPFTLVDKTSNDYEVPGQSVYGDKG
jgi:hypothetical protein